MVIVTDLNCDYLPSSILARGCYLVSISLPVLVGAYSLCMYRYILENGMSKSIWCPLNRVYTVAAEGTKQYKYVPSQAEYVSDFCWYSAQYSGTVNWIDNRS